MRLRSTLLLTLAALACAQPARAATLGYWPLDEGAPTARSDDRGSAIALSGTSAVDLGAGPALSGDLSIEIWVNAQPGARFTRYAVSKGNTSAGVHLMVDGSNRVLFRVGTGTGSTTAIAPAIASGTWHQLVATVAGRTAKLYVDGRPAASATLPAAPAASSRDLYLGRYSASASGYWRGRLDELTIDDAALSDDAVAARYAAVADTTPPTVALTAAPAAVVNATSATIAFAASKTQTTFSCQLDGGSWTACDGSATYADLAEGAHQLAVQATDRYGIVGRAPATAAWTVDVTPPETLMLASAPVGRASFSSEPGARFECRVGSGTWAACASPVAAPQGAVLSVRASDRAGNVDPSPATATIAAAPQQYASTQASFVVAGAPSTAGLECQVDGRAWGACPAPLTLTGLSFGDHQLAVRDAHLAQVAGAASLSWSVAVPLPRLISPRFPSLLTFSSRRAQRRTTASRAPRLLFLSNADAKATATLTRRGRRVATWPVAIHRGSNTMPFPIARLRRLRAGRHVLTLSPANGAGAGPALSVRFDVVALRRR